ncbi:hypothetical protein [Algisphaera agarilytica]|uniref:3-keto-disaccharide hydrolase domain-containing protein n=1 Tax=Algisphaera agarilytica TaxID=1385975 RepID=A0A7X0LKZ7_9BACT|nr:hypothetical protein [Algisphaera agarilytica]MBB6429468.1 hypothetical protein [Algisphaera agarilytica]
MGGFAKIGIGGLLVAGCCLALGLMGPALVTAQPAGEEEAPQEAASMGVLAPFLLYGEEPDGPWIGQTDGNGYRLINPDDPDAITYFFVGTKPEADGKRTFSAKVAVLQGDGKIGLFYGYQENPKEYYLLVLDSSGLLQMYHRLPEGGIVEAFNVTLEGNTDENGNPAGLMVVTLKIVEDGNSAKAYVDDVEVGTLQGPAIGTGGIGIAGFGRVDGLFLDFDLKIAD